jgi:hypothetical protein
MDCFVAFASAFARRATADMPRNDVDTVSHSRGAISPEVCQEILPSKQRAQGMPGARRARSLACKIKKHTSVVTTVTSDSPDIPRALVLTSYSVLSPVIRVCLTPSLTRIAPRKLDADLEASGPHVFTVRFRAVRQ